MLCGVSGCLGSSVLFFHFWASTLFFFVLQYEDHSSFDFQILKYIFGQQGGMQKAAVKFVGYLLKTHFPHFILKFSFLWVCRSTGLAFIFCCVNVGFVFFNF